MKKKGRKEEGVEELRIEDKRKNMKKHRWKNKGISREMFNSCACKKKWCQLGQLLP